MKAAILRELHGVVKMEDCQVPEQKEGYSLVKLQAAALNHRDVWIRKGMYAGIKLPVILGSDGCGMAMSGPLKGQRVVINPGMNWGHDEKGQAKDYIILGMPENGTFAEYVSVPDHLVFGAPAHLNARQAAALPLAGLTGFRATMVRGQAKKGEKVLVTGIGGGVALWSALFAKAAGCEVWFTSGHEEKIQKALLLGFDGGVNYKEEGWQKKLLQSAGPFDLIVDSAGGEDFGKLMDLCHMGGRIAVYGGTHGPLGNMIPAKLFWRQISILGSTMGSDADFKAMIEFVNHHQLSMPVSDVFTLDEVNSALDYMEQGKQWGKVVIDIP